MQDIYLTNLIEQSVLQKVQDAFSDMTGMAALTTDAEGHPVTEGSNFRACCMEFARKSEVGCKRCEECDKQGAIVTHDTGKTTCYHCHAGLIDFAAPIMANGKMIGSFIGGQVLTEPVDPEKVRQVAKEMGVDYADYLEAVSKAPVVDMETVNKAVKALQTIAEVLSDMALDKYRLSVLNREIENAYSTKTDFLVNMSHEIRAPMNAVIGMADMALHEDMPIKARGYISQIKSSGRALLAIINDFIDFTKFEFGMLDLRPVQYETMSMFKDASNLIMVRISDKNVELDLDINPDIPQALFGDVVRIRQVLINLANNAVKATSQGHIRISADFERISEDRIKLKVAVSDTSMGIKEDELEKLFGGYKRSDSKKRASNDGSGLGLTITKMLLNAVNGELTVESEYGSGSTFKFEVEQKIVNESPLTKVNSADEILAVSIFSDDFTINNFLRDSKKFSVVAHNLSADVDLREGCKALIEKSGDKKVFVFLDQKQLTEKNIKYIEETSDITFVLISEYLDENAYEINNLRVAKKPLSCIDLAMIYNGETISFENTDKDEEDYVAPGASVLIVDDNMVNLTVTEGLLEPTKVKVVTATSGKMALEEIKNKKFDLIFMDHFMPEMDGIETTKLIRSCRRDYETVPIIALSANAVDNARDMFIREGLNDYIAKPIDSAELLSKLKMWLPKEKVQKVVDEVVEKAPVLKIGDLSIESAMKMLGSEELFFVVLKEYYRAIDKKSANIKKYMKEKDWKSYTIEVHSLKSSSRQIGAMKLGDLAEALEKAGNRSDEDFILKNTDAALKKYTEYKAILMPYVDDESNKPEEKKAVYDEGEVRQLFALMREAMDDLDIDRMEEAGKMIKEYSFPESLAEYPDTLMDAIESMDIDKCEEIIEQWEKLL